MDILRQAFRDIAAGHSSGVVLSRPAFIRHISYADQIEHDRKREEFYEEARLEGLLTNEEKLKQLREQGTWTEKMDREIRDSRLVIDGLYEGKQKNMKMPSLVKDYAKKISEEEKTYRALLDKKEQLLGLTCETWADREINDHYIFHNLFADSELKTSLFGQTEFDYLTDEQVDQVVKGYNQAVAGCSDQGVKKLAMQPFFQQYFALTGDQLGQFFGKPLCFLTFFQVRLLNYGCHFRNIYQNHEVNKFPPNVREDPDLLTDYAAAAMKGKEELQKQGGYDEDAIVIGMKKEDSNVLGVKSQNGLAREIASKGGNVVEWATKR